MRIIIYIFMVFVGSAYADVYKCQDEKGNVKFSDNPCDAKEAVYVLDLPKGSQDGAKEYPGYNQDKYMEMSAEERNKICLQMKERYENVKSKKCFSVLDANEDRKDCVYDERIKLSVEKIKKDYEFACQI